MVNQFQRQATPRVRDLYFGVLDAIMNEHDIEPLPQRPSHIVRADASFTEVVQHTDWWLRRRDTEPYYRYRRYREVLGRMGSDGSREAHVDIGCGAGLFSWAFLDWARETNLTFDHVDLYGLDHSPEMIKLAHAMRARLTKDVPDYPNLHYTHDVDVLLKGLTAHHRDNTDYTVTFGHVLVQAHTPDAILAFAQVITHILGLMHHWSNCALMAVDARGQATEFASSWQDLLSSLERAGVRCQQLGVRRTHINDSDSAKVAQISRINRPALPR